LFNEALLAKWKWRLGIEEKGLWKNILESKYGSWKSLDDRKSDQRESKWWKDLRKICGSSEDMRTKLGLTRVCIGKWDLELGFYFGKTYG